MSKSATNLVFADTLPSFLRRACSTMSGDGGFKGWLDDRFGVGKWMHGDYPRDGFEVAIPGREISDLAVEYGYQRLSKVFTSVDPIQEANAHAFDEGGKE